MIVFLKSSIEAFRTRDAGGTRESDLQRRFLLKKWTFVCSALALCVPCGAGENLASDENQTNESEESLLLDLRPFTNPVAKFLALSGGRQLQVVHYLPSRLLVTASYERVLTDDDAMRIGAKLQERSLLEALKSKRYAGSALTPGDRFHLFLAAKAGVKGEAWGFVENTPAELRALIGDLQGLLKPQEKFTRAELADAYLRSAGITRERGQELQKSGTIRWLALEDFQPEVQSLLASAIREPFSFHPLKKRQYELLLQYRSHGNELFVTVAGGQSMSQLSLYSTK